MANYSVVNECRCCGSSNLIPTLDLGDQPLANSFHKENEQLESFPLKLMTCPYCFHNQLSIVVNPDLMFKNYLYVSGTSETLKQYFKEFAWMIKRDNPEAKKVLDIACNDCTQLDALRQVGFDTYGVDPAQNLFPIAKQKNHKVVCDYWGMDSAKALNETFDVIVAQNVFAHTHNILDFLLACKAVLNDNGRIYIQTSQSEMFINGEFDTIYHEHLSFFNIKSMCAILGQAGLCLQHVFKTSIHGSSYVFVIGNSFDIEHVKALLDKEEKEGRYSLDFYKRFADKATKVVQDLQFSIREFRKTGNKVIGYGAAAKANTVLNFAKVKLDYIVDDNPLKTGLFTPGMNIPVVAPNILKSSALGQNIVVIPLAWNFFNEIQAKVLSINPRVGFHRYL
jgi:2-polyprenyl-3-methyl-5-hydroxy-6-metoxy-1,4-benzoquinol methylase